MDSKNFLFLSLDAALIGDIAWRVHEEGHDVKHYIEVEADREIGDGFVPKIDDWRAEDDRGFAVEMLEDHGVSTLDHREFTDFDAAIAHIQENPGPYVIKPLGEVQNVTRLLYVGRDDDGGDVIDLLRAFKKAWGHRMKCFQLQRRVEGVEIAICGTFEGERFIEPVNFNFEHCFRDLLYNSSTVADAQTAITAA